MHIVFQELVKDRRLKAKGGLHWHSKDKVNPAML